MQRAALRLILLLGVVSLFADITYEGARSITGPFLSILGASGAAVGVVVGLGELVGYGVRAIAGYISDKTHKYWALTIFGYAVNLTAVPLLALATSWQIAASLIVLERFGKAMRVPARDTLLSFASKETGRGWGFGIHEALDQVGAVLGPLALSGILFLKGSYRLGFALLSIPAACALAMLLVARIGYPRPQESEKGRFSLQTTGLTKRYWIYVFAVGLVAAGYADFALIAYHFQKSSTISAVWIPFFYAVAMGVDGIAALIMGRVFDVKGISILAAVTAIAALFAPLVFFGDFSLALLGMILWGIGMGAQESIMRAVVADLAPPHIRGTAYGVMHLFFGVFWALGSVLIGFFYDISLLLVVAFSMLAQLASIPLFLSLKQKT